MKRFFALISSKGKTKEQLKEELWRAYEKYLEAEKKAEDDLMVDVTEQEQAEGTAYCIMGLPKPSESK